VTFGHDGKMSMTLMATGTHTSDQLTVGMLKLPTQEQKHLGHRATLINIQFQKHHENKIG